MIRNFKFPPDHKSGAFKAPPQTKIAILALFRDSIALKIDVYYRGPICEG